MGANKHLGFWDTRGFSSKRLGFLYIEVEEGFGVAGSALLP